MGNSSKSYYAAADLGASSGRVILGSLIDGRMELSDVNRFENGPVEHADGIHWNATELFENIREGFNKAVQKSDGQLKSVGIDTWGVDYGRLDKNDELLEQPFHYRDPRTETAVEAFFKVVPAEKLYELTGLQVQPFNTVFQLASASKQEGWDATETILFTPDLLTFWLTGKKVSEVTIASTSGILDPVTRQWSPGVVEALEEDFGIPVPGILAPLVEPGTIVGKSLPEVLDESVDVVAVGGHDTASAVVAVPAATKDFAFISSGTWSLVGMELTKPVMTESSRHANLTNELGVEKTVRYLQNIMGMWVFNECRRVWKDQGRELSLKELDALAEELPPLQYVVDINDPRLFPVCDMPARLREVAAESGQDLPDDQGIITRCIMDSLALAYKNAIAQEEDMAGQKVEVLHIVGGGCKNKLLCQLAAESTGLPVVAGPTEGTALGNLLVQAHALGDITGGLDAMREVSRNSVDVARYLPGTLPISKDAWDEANKRIGK